MSDPRRGFLRDLLKDAGEFAADRVINTLGKFNVAQDAESADQPPVDLLATQDLQAFAAQHEHGEDFYDRPFFRPPGAIPEQEFLETCSRCRKCVDACPEFCIVPSQEKQMGAPEGTPILFPNQSPCTLCGECMNVCPSGALLPIPEEFVRIGLARINELTCIAHGEEHCTACHDACPVTPNAVVFPGGFEGSSPEINPDTCTGCGLCVQPCPTEPKSVLVTLRPIDEEGDDE